MCKAMGDQNMQTLDAIIVPCECSCSVYILCVVIYDAPYAGDTHLCQNDSILFIMLSLSAAAGASASAVRFHAEIKIFTIQKINIKKFFFNFHNCQHCAQIKIYSP